jgi:hypothetical protein
MRAFPHDPDPSALSEARNRVERWMHGHDPQNLALYAEQRILQGVLDYAFEGPTSQLYAALQEGSTSFASALEAGHRPTTMDLWNYTLIALAVDNRSAAHFLASIPEERWMALFQPSIFWLVAQIRTLFALMENRDEDAAEHAGLVEKSDLLEIQNTQILLEALGRKDSIKFHQAMEKRMEIRIHSLLRQSRNVPMELIDVVGLGLIRLAQGRKMAVPIKHVYLPMG